MRGQCRPGECRPVYDGAPPVAAELWAFWRFATQGLQIGSNTVSRGVYPHQEVINHFVPLSFSLYLLDELRLLVHARELGAQ